MKQCLLAVLVTTMVLATGGCKRKRGDVSGVGSWIFGETTLGSVNCLSAKDGELTWCMHNPAVGIGHQTASVDLYFRGHDASAPLVEIILAINSCNEVEALESLVEMLGKPAEKIGTTHFWDAKRSIIAAKLPADPGTCLIHFVPPTELDTIATLRGEKKTPKDDDDGNRPVGPGTPGDVGGANAGDATQPSLSGEP